MKNYLFVNCSALRAFFNPYFLRSTFLASLVNKPAFFSLSLSSGLYLISALEIPKATASACADNPLPFRFTFKSNFFSRSNN